ncbi:MAG: HPP family protein [Alphaproteobacteria bacterium]|nr:HPP family protein [Alphaproteobacteria bacterium]MBU1548452.1 HPP family protein [Alphaproteobacteria bacterium]MBU2335786.1 HPP family protein [Alphaproteobacteria bacterium]MBU2390819.1 HPP family protein [Alphaproteobacteria bacterium]
MSFLRRLNPSIVPVSPAERIRASVGALLGILLTGLLSRMALGDSGAFPLLIAPMGASAVLLFAAPSSPLAQPWSILGGNIVSATVGVTCALLIEDPVIAASTAIAVSIGLMLLLNCLHPPSGAVALTAVLAGASIQEWGYWFVLSPVGLNTVLLLASAYAFNNATGRRYPHLAPAVSPSASAAGQAASSRPLGVVPEDLRAVLEQYDEVVNVSPEDLDALLHAAQIRAYERRSGEITCEQIMSRDVVTIAPQTSLRRAWQQLMRGPHKALPVVDADGQLVGIVTQTDFMRMSVLNEHGALSLRARAGRILPGKGAPRSVADVMTRRVQSALPETMIAKLVPPMADMGLHHMPVVNHCNHVVGIITQSDLIAALFQSQRTPFASDGTTTVVAAG